MKIKVQITKAVNAKVYQCKIGNTIEIDLNEYLIGVVASEIGNSALEACKAQAVTARTTAYPYYTKDKAISDDSSKVQCFNAERARSTKYPNAVRAVHETDGEVLFYGNSVATPCSYSDSNGGRTTSSKERWGGERAWLIAQDDPWDMAVSKGKKTGHGVGMSQCGAKYAASIGKTYAEILSFYYPNTKIHKEGVTMAYAVVSAKWLVEQFKTMVEPGKAWKYVANAASKGAVDCSGAFTYWYKQAGSYMYHGSNTMWRNYTTVKGKIGEIELVPGMAVFKRREWKSNDSGNKYYKDNIGNFYHVGLYIGDGKVVEAQSTKTGCVVTNISTWGYAARLTNTKYDIVDTLPEIKYDEIATVKTSRQGGTLFLRSKPTTLSKYLKRIPDGTKIQVGKCETAGWLRASYDGADGYVCAQYIISGQEYTMTGTTTSKDAADKIIKYAKSLGVTITII